MFDYFGIGVVVQEFEDISSKCLFLVFGVGVFWVEFFVCVVNIDDMLVYVVIVFGFIGYFLLVYVVIVIVGGKVNDLIVEQDYIVIFDLGLVMFMRFRGGMLVFDICWGNYFFFWCGSVMDDEVFDFFVYFLLLINLWIRIFELVFSLVMLIFIVVSCFFILEKDIVKCLFIFLMWFYWCFCFFLKVLWFLFILFI